jgi:hypothetical protein
VDVKVDSSLHSSFPCCSDLLLSSTLFEFIYHFNLTSSNMVNTFLIAALAAGLVTALPLYRRDDSSDPLSVESLQNATVRMELHKYTPHTEPNTAPSLW